MRRLLAWTSLLLLTLHLRSPFVKATDAPPPVYVLEVAGEPDSYRIFFSTMDDFLRLGVTKILVFLWSEGKEFHEQVPLSSATCIANSSYCYVTKSVPAHSILGREWTATLRGNIINNTEVCGFKDCPNMDAPPNCHMTVVNRPNCLVTDRSVCQLPQELLRFKTTQIIICNPNSAGPSVLIPVLLCVLTVAAAALFGAYWFLRRNRKWPPKYVVLVTDIEVLQSGRLQPALPTKREARKMAAMQEVSLAFVVGQNV